VTLWSRKPSSHTHARRETIKLRTILHHPGRIAAAAEVAGLVFAAGTAVRSENAAPVTSQPHTDAPMPSLADANTIGEYLDTLTPTERAQTIIALNPNVSGALEAIVAGNLAAANTH
jgi:hypothetical protein